MLPHDFNEFGFRAGIFKSLCRLIIQSGVISITNLFVDTVHDSSTIALVFN